jgi:hypothetical protein
MAIKNSNRRYRTMPLGAIKVCGFTSEQYNKYTLNIPSTWQREAMAFEYDPAKSTENKRKHGLILRMRRDCGRTPGYWKFQPVRQMNHVGC